jgi:hypothetical protein
VSGLDNANNSTPSKNSQIPKSSTSQSEPIMTPKLSPMLRKFLVFIKAEYFRPPLTLCPFTSSLVPSPKLVGPCMSYKSWEIRSDQEIITGNKK